MTWVWPPLPGFQDCKWRFIGIPGRRNMSSMCHPGGDWYHDWRPGFPFNLHWPKWTGITNLGEKPSNETTQEKRLKKKSGGMFLKWKILKSHKCSCLLSQLYKSIPFNHYWRVFKSSFQVGTDSRTEEAPTQIDLLPQVSLQVGNRRLILLMKEVLTISTGAGFLKIQR